MNSFRDYKNNLVSLSEESWCHIQENHPSVSRDTIKDVLLNPLEVRKSTQTNNSELFYGAKYLNKKNKVRYVQVVIKLTSHDEYLITTASIVSRMKEGECIYRNNEVFND